MARRTRPEAPSLARTRSAAPAVGVLLGYAAPDLVAWASANRDAVLRAAEAVDAAYVAAVDALAPLLPGGEGAWERARGSLLLYDSEREEHLAKRPVTVEDVEGWQSRATDTHGKRSIVALLPVRSLDVANRWAHGFGSATGSLWTMTRLAPSPETPLELASYDIRRMGVDVSQPAGEEGGGGSTMPTLDAAHNALLQAFRIAARNPHRADRLDFGPMVVRGLMRRWGFPDDVMYAVVWKETPRISTPPRFHRPSQVKAVRDALVAEGLVVPAQTDTYGRVKAWSYAPAVETFPTVEEYEDAIEALVAGLGA